MVIATRFEPSLVVLSVFVAVFASFVALHFAQSVTHASGRARVIWLTCGAFAMGFGIWSMHFIGMLAFEMPGMPMAYDMPLLILSVVVAILASWLSLFITSRPTVSSRALGFGGVAMAAGISGMHYIGMYSMRMHAHIEWDFALVALSIVIALGASFASLAIAMRLRDKLDRYELLGYASAVMGIAIAGMHYVGMIAATFVHDNNAHIQSTNILATSGLTLAVMSTTALILGFALASSVGARIFSVREANARADHTRTEERFRHIIEAVKDYAIFTLDPKGVITSWNSGAERITGYRENEVLGRSVSIFYTDEDVRRNVAGAELQIATDKGSFEIEAIRVRKDRSTFWSDIVINPLYDRDGSVLGFVKITRDVTELKEAEFRTRNLNEELEKRVRERTLALEASENQLRTIASALPTLVAQVDTSEHFLFANEAFAEWFYRDPNRVGGVSFRELLGDDRYLENKPYIDCALRGESVSYERNSKGAGRIAVLNITYVPEFDREGRPRGFIIVASDVTRYKEIESELKAAKEAAEVANATKSAFLANMSHEIRTPLGAVLGFSELLINGEMSSTEQQSTMEIIKRNGKLLSNIINDILDLSKVEAGKLEIEKIDVQVSDLISEIASFLDLEASGKSVHLKVISDGVLPKTIKTDPTRLRQILINIIGNAIKFTDRGSVDVRVKVQPAAAGSSKLVFFVRDTGAGISSEQAVKLFAPFTQADVSTTRKFGGTGLGLVLSKKLAHALGGDVVLQESRPGEGSCFVISIDCGAPNEILFHGSLSGEMRSLSAAPLNALGHLRVLVVDDSPDNQALLKKILLIAGAHVETANNGREGIDKAQSGDFDVVLMDLQMPEMDGYEATKELRRLGFKQPILALTAHAMKEERRRCLENGFNDHLTKPVDRESLIRTLANTEIKISEPANDGVSK